MRKNDLDFLLMIYFFSNKKLNLSICFMCKMYYFLISAFFFCKSTSPLISHLKVHSKTTFGELLTAATSRKEFTKMHPLEDTRLDIFAFFNNTFRKHENDIFFDISRLTSLPESLHLETNFCRQLWSSQLKRPDARIPRSLPFAP